MKRILIITGAVVALSLSGCATVNPSGVDPKDPGKTVFLATLAYDAALSAAIVYQELPKCPAKPLCSDPNVVATIQTADKVAYEALSSAQKIVRSIDASHPALETAAAWASEAIGAFTKVVAFVGRK